mmetsp:Transcript_19910/g.44438  ORF Transcript_19910/g.44438 Transcript_19910/m.44438 type:complete len:216 (-) Transcript_19910:672-1319(-)
MAVLRPSLMVMVCCCVVSRQGLRPSRRPQSPWSPHHRGWSPQQHQRQQHAAQLPNRQCSRREPRISRSRLRRSSKESENQKRSHRRMRLSQSNDRGGPPHLQLGAPSWRLLQSGRLRERQGKPQGVPGQSRRCSRLQFQTRLASEARVRQRIGLTRQALSGWPNPLRHCPLTLESERGQLNYQKREMAAGSCVARQAGRWKVAKDFRSATARLLM